MRGTETNMPGQMMSPSKPTMRWNHQEEDNYRILMHSGDKQDFVAENEVVPIDFSLVSDDLPRLVRRTYHLYAAYRIMDPIPNYRSRNSKR